MSLSYGDSKKKDKLFENTIYQFEIWCMKQAGQSFLTKSIFNFKVLSLDRITCCQIRLNIMLDEVYQQMYKLKKK